MQRLTKPLIFACIGLFSLILIPWLVLNKLSVVIISQAFEVQPAQVTVSGETQQVTRGAHLVNAVTGCPECHGADLGSKIVLDDASGTIASANLTTPERSVDDFVRAVRHGVREDERGLWLMPTAAYHGLSDDDLAAIIAYIKSLPHVQRELPPMRLGWWGRAQVALGRLALIQADASSAPVPKLGSAAARGAYLFQVARCASCHVPAGRGGPDASLAPIQRWHESDFFRAMRTGVRPDKTVIDAVKMPWKTYAALDDGELRELWVFLRDG